MGYPSGQLVGAAAATFGLISSVMVGGPVARRLIEKYSLRPILVRIWIPVLQK